MLDLQYAFSELSHRFMAYYREQEPGIFLLEIPFKMQDGTTRLQFVTGRVFAKKFRGVKDCFYIVSNCGKVHPGLNFYEILKEGRHGVHSMVTILPVKGEDEITLEMLCVQACPLVDSVRTLDDLAEIVWEVAEAADILEEKYFGEDNH
jgi:hypothetical protein